MKYLVRLIIYAIAILVIAQIIPGIVVTSYTSAIIVALLWSVLGVTLRPLLLLLTLPINFITLGLFSFVVNALVFWLVAVLAPGFSVHGFIPALEGSVALSLVGWVLHAVL